MAPLPPGKLTVIAYLYIFSDSVFSLEGTLSKHVPYSTKPVFICHCLNFDGWQQPVFGQRALRTMCTLLAAGSSNTGKRGRGVACSVAAAFYCTIGSPQRRSPVLLLLRFLPLLTYCYVVPVRRAKSTFWPPLTSSEDAYQWLES